MRISCCWIKFSAKLMFFILEKMDEKNCIQYHWDILLFVDQLVLILKNEQ
jgi:hypothetical protein